jgi:putative heme iron utilization protein
MNAEAQQVLVRLIRDQRIAAMGTLRSGAPEVTMVLFAASQDCTQFDLHVSKLAHHTQNMQKDPRVSLMISESDTGTRDPQSLARLSIQGEARQVEPSATDYESIRPAYLSKFPQSEMMFRLGDFSSFRIQPHTARLVAGFAQVYNLTLKDFVEAGKLID